MSTRVYVPTTTEGLAALVASGELPADACAEPVVAADDEEEAEYAALMGAADASTALCEEQGLPGLRRVVVVAVVDDPDQPRVTRDVVVSVHLDQADRSADDDPDDDLAWFAPEELGHLV